MPIALRKSDASRPRPERSQDQRDTWIFEEMTHGPVPVRPLVHRLPNGGAQVQTRAGNHLETRLRAPNLSKICDTSVTRLCPPAPSVNACLMLLNSKNMVGGPGFEPGASRSRIRRYSIQPCRFLRFSVRNFWSGILAGPEIGQSSAELLHEALHAAMANRRLHWPTVDRPTNASGHAYKKTRAGPSHSPRF